MQSLKSQTQAQLLLCSPKSPVRKMKRLLVLVFLLAFLFSLYKESELGSWNGMCRNLKFTFS